MVDEVDIRAAGVPAEGKGFFVGILAELIRLASAKIWRALETNTSVTNALLLRPFSVSCGEKSFSQTATVCY